VRHSKEDRRARFADALDRAARSRLDSNHVHAVDDFGLDAVGGGLGMDVGLGLGALESRAHRVTIVLAHEQDRQVPQLAKIERFVEFALGHGALAEEAGRDVGGVLHPVGERQTAGERQAAADNGVAAIEIGGLVEQVHRAAAPARTAFGLAVHLRHTAFIGTPRTSAWPCSR
jgi:hypothetical protein